MQLNKYRKFSKKKLCFEKNRSFLYYLKPVLVLYLLTCGQLINSSLHISILWPIVLDF